LAILFLNLKKSCASVLRQHGAAVKSMREARIRTQTQTATQQGAKPK
jgi:hypothetical protein